MRRWLLLAALGAALTALPVYAQRGGGHGGGGFGGHSGGFGGHMGGGSFGGHGFSGSARPSGQGFHGGGFGRPSFGRPGFGHPGFGFRPHPGFGFRGSFYGNGFYRGYPWAWGWGYPWWGYGDYGWYDTPDYNQPSASYDYPPDDYQQNGQYEQQQAEIDSLHDEVSRLREQRESEQAAHQKPSAADKPTELVFRDHRTEQIENYAIAGQTLWVLTEAHARKIPLSDLDLTATRKANEDRGVDFELPR
jgi:hypothetical protein